jgi:glycosyl transferase family 25
MNTKYIITLLTIFCFIYYIYFDRSEYFNENIYTNDYVNDYVKIFVINLANRPIKKHYMIDQLTTHNLNYNIFEAVDGVTLDIEAMYDSYVLDKTKSMGYMQRLMRRGEMGCALSHIFIWNSLMSDDKYKYYLIFEDDAILSKDFKNKLENILKDIEDKDWDILYLNDNCHPHFKDECEGNVFSNTTIKPNRIGYGLYGYVINKQFVDKVINKIHKDEIPSLFPIFMPVDDYLDYKSKINTLTCIRSKEIIVDVNTNFKSDTLGIK